MFKRPSQRVRCPPPIRGDRPKEGAFLYDIINSKPPEVFTFEKQSIYRKEDYIKVLKKNQQSLGIPYIEPILPEPTPRRIPQRIDEPELEFGDRIQVILRVLKNGMVRVKVNGAIATMYEKYYRYGKQAPIKTTLQACKAHGFSKEFLEKIKKNYDKRMIYAKKVPGILEKIFDKQPVKKVKKVKKVEKVEEEEEIVEDDETLKSDEPIEDETLKSDEPIEDETLDVEPDEDDEEVVEEEEYVSDGDD
jgi:phosphopantothenoylcysteine synthetase/decarboxylase